MVGILPFPPWNLVESTLGTSRKGTECVTANWRMSAIGPKTALAETDADGSFKRTPSSFRDRVTARGGRFKAAPGRYHLYVSLACPWASRCLAALAIKGLEETIGVSVTEPTWRKTKPDDPQDKHMGWVFAPGGDKLKDRPTIRTLYEEVTATATKYTVPLLWCTVENTIVNNESEDIVRMLNTEFNEFAKMPGIDLYPEELREQIDGINAWTYPSINNGVYRCGFATSQEAYEQAFDELFEALDRCEEILSGSRFLCGNRFTEADLRLFMTLIRFDEVYVVYFKTNKKMMREYPNLFNYIKDIYQIPGVAKTVSMDHIKRHYFTSHPVLNAYGIIPKGYPMDYRSDHDRERLGPIEGLGS